MFIPPPLPPRPPAASAPPDDCGFSSDQPPRPITDNAKRGCGGSGGPPPAVAPQARKIMRGPTFYWHLTTKHKAACVLPYLIACAVYTHAPISPAQAEPAFLLFLLLLAFRGCGPTGESLPSKGATTARRRRDFRLCVRACFVCSKKGADFLHRTVLTQRTRDTQSIVAWSRAE